MPTIDFLNQTTPAKSTDQNQSKLENMYLEEDESVSAITGEYKKVAYPMPGLTTFCDTTQSNVRAIIEQNDIIYTVAGNKLYSIASNGTKTELGTLNTSTGFAKIVSITGGSDTNNQLVIIDGTNGYYYNLGTGTGEFPIADTDFPQTATDITAQDDYVIVEKAGSISYFISNISDGKTWEALDFASKFRKADKLMAIVSSKAELWLLGTKTVEVWTNTGNANFPFERRSDVFIEEGCAARSSVIIAANRLLYLSKSLNGGYKIVVIDNYEPSTISTKAINTAINNLTTPSDCKATAYAKDGHEFVDFTFVTDNVTYTLDLGTGAWLTHSSAVSSYGRFLGRCHAFCYGKNLIGDYNSGIIYEMSSSIYTENGTAIRRRIVSPPLYLEGKRIFISRLQIDVQTNIGSNKTFDLEMSTDRGNTWELIDTYTVPTSGDGQIYTTSLGSAFCFLFRITTTMDAKFCILGFQGEVETGSL